MPAPAPTSIDGAALYAANCAGCHGALASSSKKGITLARLQSAIGGNIGNMGYLSSLSSAQQQAIVNALAVSAPAPAPTPTPTPAPAPAPAPAPTPTPIDGAALYASNCAGCHGALASSSKKGITLARLQSAISGNIGGMGYLSSLSSAQQQAIVNALAVSAPAPAPSPSPAPAPAPAPAPSPTPVDGATLYANNCASCHGPLATSSKRGATLARLQSAISGNVGGMGYLSSLSAADAQAIINALAVSSPAPAPAPTDGATLYGTYCAGCHGTLAKSSVRGSSASSIQSAITGNKGGMGYLSTLTATQIQNIANALR
jgi:mono/diheme cytochrome c family protein